MIRPSLYSAKEPPSLSFRTSKANQRRLGMSSGGLVMGTIAPYSVGVRENAEIRLWPVTMRIPPRFSVQNHGYLPLPCRRACRLQESHSSHAKILHTCSICMSGTALWRVGVAFRLGDLESPTPAVRVLGVLPYWLRSFSENMY